jgi:hypothetical protein
LVSSSRAEAAAISRRAQAPIVEKIGELLMEGIADIYMPDFKFWSPDREAQQIAWSLGLYRLDDGRQDIIRLIS